MKNKNLFLSHFFGLLFLSLVWVMGMPSCKRASLQNSPVYTLAVSDEDKALIGHSALYIAYEAETLSVAIIDNDSEAYEGSEIHNKISEVPIRDRYRSELRIEKDGSFTLKVTRQEPKHPIEGFQFESPRHPTESFAPAHEIVITDKGMTFFDKDGTQTHHEAMDLSKLGFAKLLERANEDPCNTAKDDGSIQALPFRADASLLLNDCYQEKLKENGASIEYLEEGIMVINQPVRDILRTFYGDDWVEGSRFRRQAQDTNSDSDYENERDEYQKQLEGNTKEALEGKDMTPYTQNTFVDTEEEIILGKEIYDNELLVATERYHFKEGSKDEIEVVQTEKYVTDPISNTDKTEIYQITYENVKALKNANDN